MIYGEGGFSVPLPLITYASGDEFLCAPPYTWGCIIRISSLRGQSFCKQLWNQRVAGKIPGISNLQGCSSIRQFFGASVCQRVSPPGKPIRIVKEQKAGEDGFASLPASIFSMRFLRALQCQLSEILLLLCNHRVRCDLRVERGLEPAGCGRGLRRDSGGDAGVGDEADQCQVVRGGVYRESGVGDPTSAERRRMWGTQLGGFGNEKQQRQMGLTIERHGVAYPVRTLGSLC